MAPPTPTGSGGVSTNNSGSCSSGGDTASATPTDGGDTFNTPCAPGTEDLGAADGYKSGHKHKIRLCAVPTITTTDGRLKAKVNSVVSQKFLDLEAAARSAGHKLVFNGEYSTFRTMAQQQYLCDSDKVSCSKGFTAKPGESNHQMGYAIDFNFDGYNTGSSQLNGRCKTAKSDNKRCELNESATWKWMKNNAAQKFQIHQLWYEYWHWGTEETDNPPS